MAGEMAVTDNAFSTRESPWLKVGTTLPQIATAQEAIEAAKLDWQVEKSPILYNHAGQVKTMPRKYVTVRQDTGLPLGTVGSMYKPLQNVEAFRWFDQVTKDPNGPKYVSAGSLHGGRKVWVLAKLPSFIEVIDHDPIEEYLLFSNSHAGDKSVEVMWSAMRLACLNQLTAALRRGRESRFAFRHIGEINTKVVKAQEILGIANQNHETLQESIQAMASYMPTDEEITRVLEKLLPPPSGVSESLQNKKMHAAVTSLFKTGEYNTLPGVEGTAWGLYNAITEYSDHFKPVRPNLYDADEKRFESNWFGKSAKLKGRALTAVLELVS